MNSKISNKDKKDWKNFISSKDEIPNKDLKITKDKIKKKIIKNCFNEGVNKIIVITGKGLRSKSNKNPYISKDLSILKNSIPEFIKSNVDLIKIIKQVKDAKIEHGGKGAFYIFLKK